LLARRLDLSTSPSRQDQRSLPCLLRAEALSPCLLNYSSVLQVRFDLASEADTQMARRPSGHHLSATRVVVSCAMRLATPRGGCPLLLERGYSRASSNRPYAPRECSL